MLLDIVVILLPLILGYAIPLHSRLWLSRLQKLTSQMVYLILALMGIGLAFVENLDLHLVLILKSVALFSFTICGANLLMLWWLDRRRTPLHEEEALSTHSKWQMVRESLRMALAVIPIAVVLGFLLSLLGPPLMLFFLSFHT